MAKTSFGVLTSTQMQGWSADLWRSAQRGSFLNMVTEPEPEPTDANEMTPTDFVLWLNGAIDVLDSQVPTQAQWDKMREKIAGQVGAIVAQRIRIASRPIDTQATIAGSYARAPGKSLSGAQITASQAFGIAKMQYDQQLEEAKLKIEEHLAKAQALTAMKDISFGKIEVK